MVKERHRLEQGRMYRNNPCLNANVLYDKGHISNQWREMDSIRG